MLNRWLLSWDRKTATEGAEVTDQADCSRREQWRPENLGPLLLSGFTFEVVQISPANTLYSIHA